MGTVFKFKQFEVDQRDCAMKINTDGVLLGAIVDFDNPSRILDVGSGTGVISLMLAQRFVDSWVDAVEIDTDAYLRTKENFDHSPFAARLTAYQSSFEAIENDVVYDLIVSNPPFYTNSLHNPDARKKLARHTDHDFFLTLLRFSYSKLNDNGSLQLIVPVDLALEIIDMAKPLGLYLSKQIQVRSFIDSETIRIILDLRKKPVDNVATDNLIIYETKGEYTARYKTLLSPFFLAY